MPVYVPGRSCRPFGGNAGTHVPPSVLSLPQVRDDVDGSATVHDQFHGEYKVPGGKLVVADLEVVDSTIRSARISGDFFLEPDDALERMTGALAGLPVSIDAPHLAARIEGALGEGAVLLGFSAADVAVAVRRAVTGATGWHDHEWHFLADEPHHPPMQMALDEVIAEQVAAGERPPALRVWEWASNAVIIGSFQSMANEV